MSILLDHHTVPTKGPFEIQIDRSVEITVTKEEARRIVNSWLIDEISYRMTATEPTFVLGKTVTAWRVPAVLTAPHIGHAGTVGFVDVDVTNGEICNKKSLLKNAQKLAKRIPPYTPRTDELYREWMVVDREPTHSPGQPVGNPLDLLPA